MARIEMDYHLKFFLYFLFIIIKHKIIHIVELHTERKRKNRSALCDTNKGHGNKSYSESFFKVG